MAPGRRDPRSELLISQLSVSLLIQFDHFLESNSVSAKIH